MLHTRNCIFTSRQYEFYRSNIDLGLTWRGKSHTEESRNKIRASMTPSNSKNPRIWVCKNGLVKYVLKSDLDYYLDNGFELGRKKYKPRKAAQGDRFFAGKEMLNKITTIKLLKQLLEERK